ncbi:MAG: heme o synthase [Parvularculaceae bacterium]|nr:heme o synthase [Parvularculaceae bacterium]
MVNRDNTGTSVVDDKSSFAGPRDYFALLKPRVMSLVIFTALVGMIAAVANGASVHPGLAAASLLAIAVGAGASGALNMWWDADIDAVMSRTIARPIPQGLVPRSEAAGFGALLSALSIALLALASNYVAAGLLAFTIFFYVVIYSMWLKRSTPQNIVIGGAAGALPPVVAWAAASGTAPLDAWILFLIIFLWTPPHFWALALYREGDYARAGVPMMPNVAGELSTKKQIFGYSIILVVAGIAPYATGLGGTAYLAISSAFGAGFLLLAWRVFKSQPKSKEAPKQLFAFSILYLFALFAALLAEDLYALYA